MSIFWNDGRFAPGCAVSTAIERNQTTTDSAARKRSQRASVAPLGLLACFCPGPVTSALAQTAMPTALRSGNLGPVVVTEPQRKPLKQAQPASKPIRTSARTATVADAYAYVDIPKSYFPAVNETRITFRVRNLTNKQYAVWGDPLYPDQILLGAPRTYELAAAFKW